MLTLLKKLISCPSITPEDAGCQAILIQELTNLGFHIEALNFGNVKNFWARLGTQAPLLVFAGHTDVVPPGPLEKWDSPPFTPTKKNGYLVGRGTSDMKGAIAAFVQACQDFLAEKKEFHGSIGFLITGDEEGPTNLDGTQKVIQHLQARGERIDYCIVGEASSEHQLGDSIKVGRRGSLSGDLIVNGKQGHIAYPEKARNPIPLALAFLKELHDIRWDEGNEFFPPTSLQISNIHAGTGATNVIPAHLELKFNFRYSSENSAEELQEKVEELLKKHQVEHSITWNNSAKPFLSKPGKLTQAVADSIQDIQGFKPKFATDGGTSDARFIAPTGTEVIELGVCRDSIHQINEHVKISDLEKLTEIYRDILARILRKN